MIRKAAVTAGVLRVALRPGVFAVKFKLYHYRNFGIEEESNSIPKFPNPKSQNYFPVIHTLSASLHLGI